jgi:hypothetical protein
MGWEIGYEPERDRDIGYGVPSECDHPDCKEQIDRGLAYVCGGEPYGGEYGCGLFFCEEHLLMAGVVVVLTPASGEWVQLCERCEAGSDPFEPKPDVKEWTDFKATDPSWAKWRSEQAVGHRRGR